MIRTAVLPLLLAVYASPAAAGPIVDNGDPTLGFGTAVLSELNSTNQVGDDFSLSSDSTIGSIEWWGTGSGNAFSIRIFSIDAGTPSATAFATFDVGTVAGTTQSFSGVDFLHYSVAVADFELLGGNYLLSIVETGAGDDWFWAASCEDPCLGTRFERDAEGSAWSAANFDMSFRMFGIQVPEPGTGLLFSVGLTLLGLSRRRARSTPALSAPVSEPYPGHGRA